MWLPLLTAFALAADDWTNPHPGIDILHRTTSDPQDIWAARIDLGSPYVGLHASSDESGVERGVNTRSFANNTDMAVAINGDWSDGSTPVGLAISDGWRWHDHIHDDTLGGEWGFLACTPDKRCTVDTELPLDTAWWFTNPTVAPYRYWQAVGANGLQMVDDGVSLSGCYDSSRNPRSATCVDATGTVLWLIAVDGRTSRANGMTCDEMRAFMQELGCWDGAMLDGGGSTTFVVDGVIRNNPSDGSPRTVSNHFGVIWNDAPDAACGVDNGLWCEGTVISACQGGRLTGSGDCAAYGCGCQEDGDFAFCVDPRCPGGDGQGARCLDGTVIEACNDGQYGTGDCGAFGLVCGTDAAGSDCMDPRCEAGPHSSFCTDGGLLGTCTDGLYAESACPDGWACEAGACVDPDADTGGDSGGDNGGGDNAGGDNGGDNGGGTDGGGDDGGVDGGGDGPGDKVPGDEAGCGCRSGGEAGHGLGLVALLLAAARGRRRAEDRR